MNNFIFKGAFDLWINDPDEGERHPFIMDERNVNSQLRAEANREARDEEKAAQKAAQREVSKEDAR